MSAVRSSFFQRFNRPVNVAATAGVMSVASGAGDGTGDGDGHSDGDGGGDGGNSPSSYGCTHCVRVMRVQ